MQKRKSKKGPNNWYLGAGVILVFVVIIIAYLVRTPSENKMESTLKNIGGTYYTEFLYNQYYQSMQGESLTDFLAKYENNGLTTTLTNAYTPINDNIRTKIDDFMNREGKNCNKDNTKITIYPQNPYGKDDYVVAVSLDCTGI